MKRERCWHASTSRPSTCWAFSVYVLWLFVADMDGRTSHVMKRVDALTWTPYMGECLESLSQQPEWDGDELLVALVKHQLLVEQLTRAVWQSSDDVAPLFLPAALRSQLNDLRSQLPVHVQQNRQ